MSFCVIQMLLNFLKFWFDFRNVKKMFKIKFIWIFRPFEMKVWMSSKWKYFYWTMKSSFRSLCKRVKSITIILRYHRNICQVLSCVRALIYRNFSCFVTEVTKLPIVSDGDQSTSQITSRTKLMDQGMELLTNEVWNSAKNSNDWGTTRFTLG